MKEQCVVSLFCTWLMNLSKWVSHLTLAHLQHLRKSPTWIYSSLLIFSSPFVFCKHQHKCSAVGWKPFRIKKQQLPLTYSLCKTNHFVCQNTSCHHDLCLYYGFVGLDDLHGGCVPRWRRQVFIHISVIFGFWWYFLKIPLLVKRGV